jgi:hypothetical protein
MFSQGLVHSAVLLGTTEADTRLFAVKKSRVSLRVQRTILKHESHVLLLLQGHPAIPVLYGYGRFKHFEYIAMEQLGSTLTKLHPSPYGLPLVTVLLIADQMVRIRHALNLQWFLNQLALGFGSCQRPWYRPLRYQARKHACMYERP